MTRFVRTLNPSKGAWLWLLAGGMTFWGCVASNPGGSPIDIWSRMRVAAKVVNLPAGERDQGVVACFAEVAYRDIQFVRKDDGYWGELEFTFSLYTKENSEPVRLIDRKKTIHVASFSETVDRKKTLRIVQKFKVPHGKYKARVVVRDRNARSMGVADEAVEVTDLYSRLSISRPILMWDSVTTLAAESMIPFHNRNYDKDFFALVIVGGINPEKPFLLQYRLEDQRKQVLFEKVSRIPAAGPVNYVSLRIPVGKLALGKTHLFVEAQQEGQKASTEMELYSSLGRVSQYMDNVKNYIGPMKYIMPADEWGKLKSADPEEQNKIFEAFWKERDPDPSDEENPLLEEFYARVQEANQRFGWGADEGWRTDRGRIYIIYGPPDAIERQRSTRTGITYEIWRYYNLGRQFVFEDRYNNGNFRLYSSN